MELFLSLDIGTTAVKAGLFDQAFNQIDVVIEEYTLYTPQSDIVELNPETYWENSVKAIENVIRKSRKNIKDIVSITFTTQGETLIPVDENGKSIGNAIVWLDERAKAEADIIRQLEGIKEAGNDNETSIGLEEFFSKTGLPGVDGFLPLSKLLWFKQHRPEEYKKTNKFLLLEDYMIYRFSGKMVSNPSILSSTGYFDITKDEYRKEILDKCGIDIQKLPDFIPCGKIVGTVTQQLVETMGFSENAVVTTGAMDQIAMAVGCGSVKEGVVNDTIGTAQVTGTTVESSFLTSYKGITVYRHAMPNKYYALLFNQNAGIIMKWFRNEFCKDIVTEYGESNAFVKMSELAEKAGPMANGVTFINDGQEKSSFSGVGIDTSRGCFIRAIMESVCFTAKEYLKRLKPDCDVIVSLGGGARSPVWNQIKADILEKTNVVPGIEEAALLGAAILGAFALGRISDISEVNEGTRENKVYYPIADNVRIYKEQKNYVY